MSDGMSNPMPLIPISEVPIAGSVYSNIVHNGY
jgi:hypothetical protein